VGPTAEPRYLDLPRHVAIVMDGNGRWARSRGLERVMGHDRGARAVREVVRTCRERGVPYLTLYAFSLDNWARPKLEVGALMRLLIRFSQRECAELKEKHIAVRVVGDIDALPSPTRRAVDKLIEDTNTLPPGVQKPAMTLSLALSYSGRQDIVNAMRAIAALARAGQLGPEDIDRSNLRNHFSTSGLPDVDLLIRTGGEQRLSDFLLVEAAYAELYFTPVLWPDFRAADLLEAFAWYSGRERRFGRTGEQVRLANVV
jgi:undecaprenyl diphosphate synthase